MCIGNVDKRASNKLTMKFRRKSMEQRHRNKHHNAMSLPTPTVGDITSRSKAKSDEDDNHINQDIVSDDS